MRQSTSQALSRSFSTHLVPFGNSLTVGLFLLDIIDKEGNRVFGERLPNRGGALRVLMRTLRDEGRRHGLIHSSFNLKTPGLEIDAWVPSVEGIGNSFTRWESIRAQAADFSTII